MSPRREEGATVDTDAGAAHAAVELRTNMGASSSSSRDTEAESDLPRRSPLLSFSRGRVGSPKDAGAQQQ